MKSTIVACLLFALPAFASNESSMSGGSSSSTSATNRMSKSVGINATLAGFGGPAPETLSQGMTIGFYAPGDSFLAINAMSGRRAIGRYLIDLEGDGDETNAKSVGVSFQKFTGNSLYLRLAADYRKVNYRQYWSYHPGERSFEGEAVNASFSFGNQWQLAGFTIGCEWAGIGVPVASRVTSESVTGDLSGSSASDYELAKKRNLTDTSISVARFYVGASF